MSSFADLLKRCVKQANVKVIDDNTYKQLEDICPVQRPWLYYLPWKMQTVINQGLRAPDSIFSPKIKIVGRWMRSVCLCNADKNHTFMCKKIDLPTWEDLDNEFNYLTIHFATHFLYALEIIGYKHPDPDVRKTAKTLYEGLVNLQMHLNIEREEDLDRRLADVSKKELPDIFKEAPQPKVCPTNDRYIRR